MYEQIARNKRLAVVYIVVFFVVWVGVGAAVGSLWAALSPSPEGEVSGVGTQAATGAVVAAVVAVGAIVFSQRMGATLVLTTAGAVPADRQQYRQLHNLVESLAIGAGLPKPAVYVIDDPSPNAFATGMSPERAAITVTTGLLAIMNRQELEGVVAHELSHIKNYDVRLLLVVSTLIGLAGLLSGLAFRTRFLMGNNRDRRAGQLTTVIFVAGLLLAVVSYLFGPLVRLALSRRRESLADVSAGELTRNPAGLIGALKKLQTNEQPLTRYNQATAAMCIDDPHEHRRKRLRAMYATHPPLDERIAILKAIAVGEVV